MSLTLPPNTVLRSIYLHTNVPTEYLASVDLQRGSDTPLSLSGDEIIMLERFNKRPIIENFVPFHIADISARTLPGQDGLERPFYANDNHTLKVKFKTDLPATAEGGAAFYMQAYASFASNQEYVRDQSGAVITKDGQPQIIPRIREIERRFQRFYINNVSKGEVVFDKLPLGPKLRQLIIKGNVSKLEVEARINGEVRKRIEITKELNEYQLIAEHGKAPQEGVFIFCPVMSGFMSDFMSTDYDDLQFKLTHESDQKTIEIIADILQSAGVNG